MYDLAMFAIGGGIYATLANGIADETLKSHTSLANKLFHIVGCLLLVLFMAAITDNTGMAMLKMLVTVTTHLCLVFAHNWKDWKSPAGQ